jgi:hypothetical protein
VSSFPDDWIGNAKNQCIKIQEQCLTLLENLDPEGIVITKHGKPIARLIPANSNCAELIGSMKEN